MLNFPLEQRGRKRKHFMFIIAEIPIVCGAYGKRGNFARIAGKKSNGMKRKGKKDERF